MGPSSPVGLGAGKRKSNGEAGAVRWSSGTQAGRSPIIPSPRERAVPGGRSMSIDYERRIAELERQLAERTRALSEALETQAVTSEILRVMSESPTDDQPVLDAIARSARRLCGADQVWLNLIDGHEVVNVAAEGVPGEWRRSRGPIDPASSFAYVIREQRVVQFCGYDDPL